MTAAANGPDVYLTVDAEPDCPPFLWTWRGMEEGMPALFDLLEAEKVPATFFTTGRTAELHRDCVAEIPRRGHELACHGYSHEPFTAMDEATARDEIVRTNRILRAIAPVVSFRAPYLSFPERFVPILAADGIAIDSSRAAYKRKQKPWPMDGGPARLTVSVTASVLRLPRLVRDPWLAALRGPVTLFVHPWEFVDLTRAPIRYDCRFRTGEPALDGLKGTIRFFKARGARFRLVRDYAPGRSI